MNIRKNISNEKCGDLTTHKSNMCRDEDDALGGDMGPVLSTGDITSSSGPLDHIFHSNVTASDIDEIARDIEVNKMIIDKLPTPMTQVNQYERLCNRIIDTGEWVYNKRTGKQCLTVINADHTYDVGKNHFPLVTTRKSYWKAAIAELLGYLRGYSSAAQFRELGTSTWDKNANENEDWLNNPYRTGEDDMGRVYGVQARSWRIPGSDKSLDQLKKVYNNLKKGVDDRGEIITFYNPGEFHMGCLRPCMHTHHFSLLGGNLYLNSIQRSADVPLGVNFNQVQVFALLALMAQITGHEPALAYHKMINAHIYEDQLDSMKIQVEREPYAPPSLNINPDIKTLKDIETWVTLDDFEVIDYKYHPPIEYKFSK